MAIDSTSGHETRVTDFIANHLQSLNWTVELQSVHNPVLDPSIRRENIYAYLGTNRTTRLLINSHVDTVPPFYPPSDDNEYVYGRGANDAKGQIAVQLFALERLRKANKIKEGDVAILWDVGEEEYADGIRAANSFNITPIWSITGEPTESYQATGHKGGECLFKLITERNVDIEIRSGLRIRFHRIFKLYWSVSSLFRAATWTQCNSPARGCIQPSGPETVCSQ